jgi:hypothetical protein
MGDAAVLEADIVRISRMLVATPPAYSSIDREAKVGNPPWRRALSVTISS